MSKGLETLREIGKEVIKVNCLAGWIVETVKEAYGIRFDGIEEELEDGEKYKKALEIVNNKGVLVDELKRSASVDDYNMTATYYDINYCKLGLLTQDEFDLLKEVFK